MLIQNKIVDAAKSIISSSLATNNITDWTIYGMFDITPQTGIKFPCVRVQCLDEEPAYKDNVTGWHMANLELITTAIRLSGSMAGGTSATEFENVSDMIFNSFISNTAANNMQAYANNLVIQGLFENGLEVSPLTDGWIATQKFEVICARTA